MAVELERVCHRWIVPEMLFSSMIDCPLEQRQILCSLLLLLITKVSKEAWSSMHLNIFFRHLLGGVVLRAFKAASSCLPVSVSAAHSHSASMNSHWRLITQRRWGEKQRPIHLCQGKWTAPQRSGWMHWQWHLSQARPLHEHKVRVLPVCPSPRATVWQTHH